MISFLSLLIKKKSRRSPSSWVGKEDSKRVITWVRLSKGRVAEGDDFDSAADVLMVKNINWEMSIDCCSQTPALMKKSSPSMDSGHPVPESRACNPTICVCLSASTWLISWRGEVLITNLTPTCQPGLAWVVVASFIPHHPPCGMSLKRWLWGQIVTFHRSGPAFVVASASGASFVATAGIIFEAQGLMDFFQSWQGKMGWSWCGTTLANTLWLQVMCWDVPKKQARQP